MSVFKDKKSLIKYLMENLDKFDRFDTKFTEIADKLKNNEKELTDAEIRTYLLNLTNTQKTYGSMLKNLFLNMIIYTSGENFDSDMARILMKMGKGQEALKTMFKNKMGG